MRNKLLALGLNCLFMAAIGGAAATDIATSARQTLCFNPNWRFIKADPAGAARPEFDDSGWQTVSTPHTFNDIDTFDDFNPKGMLGEQNLWTGRSWYRKTFIKGTGD